MFDTEALKALGAFPLIQAALAILILGGGYFAMTRGNKDRNGASKESGFPQWLMMGPAHDAIGAIHDIAEQSRKQTDLLDRMAEEARRQTGVLELIRNESRLR